MHNTSFTRQIDNCNENKMDAVEGELTQDVSTLTLRQHLACIIEKELTIYCMNF